MRWPEKEVKAKYIPQTGDQKVEKEFLILPMCLEGEWRWWEKAKVLYEYQYKYCTEDRAYYHWVPIKWIDEEN